MCIINEMPEIHFHQTTTLTPELFVAGLTDFRPGRSRLCQSDRNLERQVRDS
jgi:hypothetical protein